MKKKLKHIIEMIKNKDKFKSNFAKHGLINDQIQIYKLKEDIINETVKNKQVEINFLDKLEKTPVSTKPFWSKINKTRVKNNSNNIPTLIKEGIELTTDDAKANLFAEKLKNTFNEIDLVGFDDEFKNIIDTNIINKT